MLRSDRFYFMLTISEVGNETDLKRAKNHVGIVGARSPECILGAQLWAIRASATHLVAVSISSLRDETASRQRCSSRLVPISSLSRPVSRPEEKLRELSRHAPWRRGALLFVCDAHSLAREWASFIFVKIVSF